MKSATRSVLVDSGQRLEICRCGYHRMAYLPPAEAAPLLGAGTTFPAASRRLWCSVCGARGRDGMVSARASVIAHYAALRAMGMGLPG